MMKLKMIITTPDLQEQSLKWIVSFVLIIAFFGLGTQTSKAKDKLQAEQTVNQSHENIKRNPAMRL